MWPWRATVRLLVVLALAGGVLACPGRAAAEELRVMVLTILATDQDAKIDPEIKCLAEHVRKRVPELTGFRLACSACKLMTVGKPEKMELVDGQMVTIVVRHGADEDNRVGLKVKPPRCGEITYTTTCGKFFPMLTCYHTRKGERLIIAVAVKSCKVKESDCPKGK